MKKTKQVLSIVLALCMLVSMFSIGAITASANYGDELHNADVKDVVPAAYAKKTLYFYMPDEWRNVYNDTYDGESLDSCSAGIYWWDTSYSPNEYYSERLDWPGYNVTETDSADSNIFVAHCPADISTVIFNNTVDGGDLSDNDYERYAAALQTSNLTAEYYMSGEDKYGFYPDGTDDINGMIFVCNLNDTDVNYFTGRKTYQGAWFYYYGNGEYGVYKDYDEALENDAVYSGGAWPGGEPASDDQPVTEAPETQPATTPVDTEDGFIYFDASEWRNYSIIYCHIWERGGDSFFPWQSKKEACRKVDGNIYSYDLSTLEKSTTNSGGLKPDTDYCVIFSANTGAQTYDLTFGLDCVGDTAYLTGDPIENPVDSEKTASEAVWTENSDDYGPHLAISSSGNIIGDISCPGERAEETIGDWVVVYYKSASVNPVEALTRAYEAFGITEISQINDIIEYVKSKETGEDEHAIKKVIEDAFARVYHPKPTETKDTTNTGDKLVLDEWVTGSGDNYEDEYYSKDFKFVPEDSGYYRFLVRSTGDYISAQLYDDYDDFPVRWDASMREEDDYDEYVTASFSLYMEADEQYILRTGTDVKNVSAFAEFSDTPFEDEEDTEYLSTFESGDFVYGVVKEDEEVYVKSYIGNKKRVVIPSYVDGFDVTGIGSSAFEDDFNIKSVVIPDTVTEIASWAFCGCDNLKNVDLGNGVSSIGYCAFLHCDSLSEIDLPESLEFVDSWAFENTALTSVVIPKSVKDIGQGAFGYSYFPPVDDEEDGTDQIVEGFVIKGYKGTEAESYAKENGFEFEALDEPVSEPTAAPATEPVETQPSTDSPSAPTTSPAGDSGSSATAPSTSGSGSASSGTGKIAAKKKANPVKVTVKKKTVKKSKLKKKKLTVKAITVKKAKGKVSYKKMSGATCLKINKTTGKITIKKGTKKGTYKIKVKITVKGNASYSAAAITKTVKIKVK